MALPKGMTPSEMRALVGPNLAHLLVTTFDDVARQVDLLNHQIVYENGFIGQVGKVYHSTPQVCRIFLPGTRFLAANNYGDRDRQANAAITGYTYNSRQKCKCNGNITSISGPEDTSLANQATPDHVDTGSIQQTLNRAITDKNKPPLYIRNC